MVGDKSKKASVNTAKNLNINKTTVIVLFSLFNGFFTYSNPAYSKLRATTIIVVHHEYDMNISVIKNNYCYKFVLILDINPNLLLLATHYK
jgi:hypothetical protein